MNNQLTLAPTKVDEIVEIVQSEVFVTNAKDTYKGNKAAGVRLRKQLKTIADLAKEARKEVSDIKAKQKVHDSAQARTVIGLVAIL